MVDKIFKDLMVITGEKKAGISIIKSHPSHSGIYQVFWKVRSEGFGIRQRGPEDDYVPLVVWVTLHKLPVFPDF